MKGASRLLEHECTMVALVLNVYPFEEQWNEVKKFGKYTQGQQAYISYHDCK